jgi:hypothetical protein
MATLRDLVDPTDPTDLQPEQRQREVAAILAAGVIRIRVKQAARVAPSGQTRPRWGGGTTSSIRRGAACMPKISPEFGEIPLELPRPGRPDGLCG